MQIAKINEIPHPFHSHEDPDIAYRITPPISHLSIKNTK